MNRSRWSAGARWRGRLLAHLAVVLPLAAAGLAAQALATAPAAQATPTTTIFTYTGSEQTYTVPAGVTAVTITEVGAPGGAGLNGAAGRNGASVTATVPLPAGTTTLYVEVGGAGMTATNALGQTGGFNGGGSGQVGGTGGGASDVRTCSMSTCTDLSANDTRLVVAGGGGGGGGACGTAGGAAGDSSVTGPGNGGAGNDPCGGAGPGGNGGLGGTAGGTGGAGSAVLTGCVGGGGSLGQGGSGIFCASSGAGGGGGGGYYGGGGGGAGAASGGGGGAGSSFWVTGATGTSMSKDTTGTPEVQITPIITAPDLSLSDSAPATAVSGQPYAYTLQATSTGGSAAAGVAVTDALPASAHFTSATTSQGSCTRPSASKGGTVSCTVGSLAAGASVTITITVTATKPGTVSDNAKAAASNVTPDSDDAASASTTVQGT